MTVEDNKLQEATNIQEAFREILKGEQQASEMESKLDEVEKNLDFLLKQLESLEGESFGKETVRGLSKRNE